MSQRILIISQYFWPEDFRINDLALGLRERGHQITVLSGIPNYPTGRFAPGYGYLGPTRQDFNGITVLRVPLLRRRTGKAWHLALNYLSFALSASLLGPFVCRGDFDLIFVFEPSPITVGIPALIMKRFKSAPIMFWVQDLWPESLAATGAIQSPTLLRMVERLVQFIYRGCDRVLVTSRGFISRVEQVGADPASVRYFPQWAENVFQPVNLEANAPEVAALPQGFRVLFAGNIGAAQGFPTILDAAERTRAHADIHWVVFGDGRMLSWVRAQVQERGLASTVHLLGRHPLEVMPRYFSLADVLLVTLKRDPVLALTVPGKLQPYMACGRPILAALDGEGARIVEEAGAGMACPAEDPDRLAEAVLRLYGMPAEEREAMGQRGRRYYEAHFDRRVLLDKLDSWMDELTADLVPYPS